MASGEGSKPRTRHNSSCKLSTYVGAAKEFSLADVPTVRAVIRRGLLLKEQKLLEGIDTRHYSAKQIARDLAPLVEAQWLKSNVAFVFPVIVTKKRIVWIKVMNMIARLFSWTD